MASQSDPGRRFLEILTAQPTVTHRVLIAVGLLLVAVLRRSVFTGLVVSAVLSAGGLTLASESTRQEPVADPIRGLLGPTGGWETFSGAGSDANCLSFIRHDAEI